MKELLTEPCRPYDLYPGPDAVDLDVILGRLSSWQIRRLAIALALHRPDVFEERILQFWADRRQAAAKRAAADD